MAGAPREYAAYLRKSKGHMGIPRQRTLTSGHVEDAGGVIAAEFTDTDRTAFRKVGAARPEREGFDAMLGWLAARRGAGVAAYHADRLLRDPEETEHLIRACVAGDHLVVTARGGTYDLSTANGRKNLRSDANDATYEVDHGRERILDQKTEAAAAGAWLGSMRPFGYEGIPAEPGGERKFDGLRAVPAEAAAIRAAAEDVLEGASLHSVVAGWKARGITGTYGGEWTVSNLRRLLMRPRYAGIAEHNGREAGKAQWEPILPLEVFRALQVKLDARANPGHSTARRWLGSGLYRCGVCGKTVRVRGTASAANAGRQKSYTCEGHIGRQVTATDHYVTEFVLAVLEQPGFASRLAARLAQGTPRGEDVTLLRAQAAVIEGRRRKLGEHYAAGTIGDDELAAGAAAAREETAALSRRIAAAGRLSPLTAVAGDPQIRQKWPGMELSRRQAVIAALITVRIHPAGPGRPKGVPWKAGVTWFDETLIEIIPGPLLQEEEPGTAGMPG